MVLYYYVIIEFSRYIYFVIIVIYIVIYDKHSSSLQNKFGLDL